MYLPRRRYHHILRSTDGLTVLARIDIVPILVHYPATLYTLLADVTLSCGMYPARKVDISLHLVILGFPQSDHTVGKPNADAGSLCSKA